ncbi:unnamed protein product [Mytilus coruscus]|uniref:DZIP3-like HEPN domain-containing protein n=1 Tax=Mytilus coruscus TaxID=42192 RepID=A0A6J8DZ24_MYTCO|nr:unnamed protein product [Mytilus coruscus]
MAEASLSNEEENYVRMSLLLTGISPRGVRALFDREFAPICLYASLKKEFNKLNELKMQHIISQPQWNLLFTKSPGKHRNLTDIVPPYCGYDRLPTTETTPAADLSRIKYYRNYLAHLDEGKIDTEFFNTAWTDITDAIDRLEGQIMKRECDQLKTKPLDPTNQEIIMDIKRSNDEIKQLKGSLESLRLSHLKMERSQDEVKKSHALLQEQVANCQQDTVPWNIRGKLLQVKL